MQQAFTSLRGREAVMKTPLLTIIMVIALIVLGGQTIKKACKTGHHTWCAPESMWHRTKARTPV
jgi:hypothetical protein